MKEKIKFGDILRNGPSQSLAPQINLNKTKPPVNFTDDPIEFIESKEYLGEKLFPKQKEIITEFFTTDSETQKRKFNELILIVGMRGGKSNLAGYVGSFCVNKLMKLGNKDDIKSHFKLSKASTISIPVIANSEDQAEKTIFGYLKKLHMNFDYWKKVNQWLIDQEPLGMKHNFFNANDSGGITYGFHDIEIRTVPSTSDTLAGLTSYCTLFDEISRLRVAGGDVQGKTEKKSAQAIYYTLSRQIKTFKNEGNSIVVSSPMYEDDFGMQLLLKSGKLVTGDMGQYTIPMLADKIPTNQKKKSRLSYHYATWEYNPNYVEADFNDEKNENMLAFKRDFMAIPPASIQPFFEDRIALKQAINPNRKHIVECETEVVAKHRTDPYNGEILDTREYIIRRVSDCLKDKLTKRYIVCDQGLKWDNFVLTIGHPEPIEVDRDGHKQVFCKTVVDAILIWEPHNNGSVQVDFNNVESVILEITKNLLIEIVTYDRWQSTKPIQSLFDQNVNSQTLSITNSMYQSFKKRLYAGLIDSVDVDSVIGKSKNLLMDELVKLQLMKGTKVDHTNSSSKDISDCICRLDALVQTYEYENYGESSKGMKGAGIVLDPNDKGFNVNQTYNTLRSEFAPSGGIWNNAEDEVTDAITSSHKNIWGRQGVVRRGKDVASRKIHPAQEFFKQRGGNSDNIR
jgi:hypothetical protein